MSHNIIINGAFDIWQRGTLFPNQPGGGYSADRWTYSNASACWHTISRDTDVPDELILNYSMKAECTTPDADLCSTDYTAILYKIEGYDIKAVMGQVVTLSFWVKSNKIGTYCLAFGNYGGNDAYYVTEYIIYEADKWEKKSITITFHSGRTGTWNFTNGAGACILWTLASGANHILGPANTWVSGPNAATYNQVNAVSDAGIWFKLAGVQFEIGTETPFQHRHIQQELAMCQRYYEVLGGHLATAPMISMYAGAGNTVAYGVPFKVSKRAVPTVSVLGNWTNFNCSRPTAVNPTTEGYMITSIAQESGTVVYYPADTTGIVEAKCEL